MAGQLWAVNSLGGYMYSLNLSKELRTAVQPACKFRQLCDAHDAAMQGKHKGDVFHWNVYSNLSDDGSVGKDGLKETETMPEDNFTITQGSLEIKEFGRSVPYSGKLDDMSEQPVKEIIRKVLKDHAVKSLDRAAHAEFAKAPLRAVGTAAGTVTFTDNGTASVDNNAPMDKEHVKAIVDYMKERNIPQFGSGDYFCVGWPTTFRTFKNNLETIHQYVETGLAKIMNGEIGRYEGVRFIEQTNVPKTTGSTANAAWTNGKSNWAVFMGEDTVAEAIAVPEEIRGKIPTDYGRSKGVAWYGELGYGLVHTTDNPVEGRIVVWDSAH